MEIIIINLSTCYRKNMHGGLDPLVPVQTVPTRSNQSSFLSIADPGKEKKNDGARIQ
jgi:hypothetical protein